MPDRVAFFAPLWIAAVPHELGPLDGAAVGVGAVRAGVGAARAIAAARPRTVVLIGSAGAYPGGPPIGAVVQAARLGLADAAAAVGLGYVPLPPAPLTADPDLRRWLAVPEVDVLTTGAVTTDAAAAAQLGAQLESGWHLEHLEAWAVAYAAQEAGVPFAAVFGVANEVGPDAHAQWLAHHAAVEAAVRALIGHRLTVHAATTGLGAGP